MREAGFIALMRLQRGNTKSAAPEADLLLPEDPEHLEPKLRTLAPTDLAASIQLPKEFLMPVRRRLPHAPIVRRLQSSWFATFVSVVIVAGVSAPGASTATRKWYWTESHAEAAVIAHVRIPYCRIDPSDSRCGAATPFRVGVAVISADCRGANELRQTFRYNRFTCQIVTYNNGAEGKIAVYPVSATAFHWKIL